MSIKKLDKVKVVSNEGFEQYLKKGQTFQVCAVDDKGEIDIGFKRNFPAELFILDKQPKCDFTEERDILTDIFWTKDLEIPELEEQIAQVNYLQAYYGQKLEQSVKELKILELDFDIWYDKTIERVMTDSLKSCGDNKTRADFEKKYNAANKERRLVTLTYPEEYHRKRMDIIEKEEEIGKLKTVLKSLETKAINLNIINKNHKEYE